MPDMDAIAAARSALVTYLRETEAEQIALLQRLLRAPSANPPGDTRQAADVLCRFLSDAGAPAAVHAARPDLPNLVATFDGARPGGHLVFNGHIDVFPPNDEKGWSGERRDGRLYGRGAADMKAGTTASTFAFAALHRFRDVLPGKVTLTAVSDEQTGGGLGTKWLFETMGEAIRGDVLLNGEPSGTNNIRFMEKGTLRFTVTVRTPGGHGGYPHLSSSAIKIAAAIIAALDALHGFAPPLPDAVAHALTDPRAIAVYNAGLGQGASDWVRQMTFNAGVIRGGRKVNQLPDLCEIECDIRYPWGLTRESVMANVTRILSAFPEASWGVTETHSYPPSLAPPDDPMVRILADVVERDLGAPRPIACSSLGGSDSRYWRYAGVPAYLYGPSPVTMGRSDEHVTEAEFLLVAKAHALAAFDWLVQRVA